MKPFKTIITLLAFTPFFLKAKEKPNIIFILADDMGYKDLGCYGNCQKRGCCLLRHMHILPVARQEPL